MANAQLALLVLLLGVLRLDVGGELDLVAEALLAPRALAGLLLVAHQRVTLEIGALQTMMREKITSIILD